jgi:hypothetical protein
MNRQRGVSLSGLMVLTVFVILVALLGMKVGPSVIEYNQILKAARAVGQDSRLKGGSVADVRNAYSKYQEIDNITKITPGDLDISKDGGDLVVSFAYQDKIKLFGNVSLVIDYEGSSAK